MKIGKLKVTAFVTIGLLASIIIISFKIADEARNRFCDNLEKLARTPEIQQKLWVAITKYKTDPFFLSDLYDSKGLIYIKDTKSRLNLDWEELGLPLEHATLEIRGKNINYKKILARQVEEIRVGLGYRDHIVFKVNHNVESNPLGKEFSISVECSDATVKSRIVPLQPG